MTQITPKAKRRWWFYTSAIVTFIFYALTFVGGIAAVVAGGDLDSPKGFAMAPASAIGLVAVFLAFKNKWYAILLPVISVAIVTIFGMFETNNSIRRDFTGILIAYCVPCVLLLPTIFHTLRQEPAANIIMLVISLIFMVAGLLSMGEWTPGAGVFALGGLQFGYTTRRMWQTRKKTEA